MFVIGYFINSKSCSVQKAGPCISNTNREIFGADGSKFYMYTDRTFEGKPSKPWEGGKYGYVRNPKRTSSGILYSKFHEGIDIKPIARNSTVSPLIKFDRFHTEKLSIPANLQVPVTMGNMLLSNTTGDMENFTVCMPILRIFHNNGQIVRPGSSIGTLVILVMGLTKLAHLHLELNLMLSKSFKVVSKTLCFTK